MRRQFQLTNRATFINGTQLLPWLMAAFGFASRFFLLMCASTEMFLCSHRVCHYVQFKQNIVTVNNNTNSQQYLSVNNNRHKVTALQIIKKFPFSHTGGPLHVNCHFFTVDFSQIMHHFFAVHGLTLVSPIYRV